jgi:hypothetical protein
VGMSLVVSLLLMSAVAAVATAGSGSIAASSLGGGGGGHNVSSSASWRLQPCAQLVRPSFPPTTDPCSPFTCPSGVVCIFLKYHILITKKIVYWVYLNIYIYEMKCWWQGWWLGSGVEAEAAEALLGSALSLEQPAVVGVPGTSRPSSGLLLLQVPPPASSAPARHVR